MNMRKRTFSLFLFLLVTVFLQQPLKAQLIKPDTLDIVYTKDFSLDGTGVNYNWGKAQSISLQQLDEGLQGYETKFKVMYSAKGIYVLFTGKDLKSTSNYKNDFDDLYNADVFEVFLHPDPSTPLYFEYEVSPKDKELVLLIPNIDGKIMEWLVCRVVLPLCFAKSNEKYSSNQGHHLAWKFLSARLRCWPDGEMGLVARGKKFS